MFNRTGCYNDSRQCHAKDVIQLSNALRKMSCQLVFFYDAANVRNKPEGVSDAAVLMPVVVTEGGNVVPVTPVSTTAVPKDGKQFSVKFTTRLIFKATIFTGFKLKENHDWQQCCQVTK